MSPFAIFTIVLTIAYIIYYGVNISRDLYGKKGQENKTGEIIDVSNVSGIEEPIPVTEDGDGFVMGTQASHENSSELDLSREQGNEEQKNDDSYKSGIAEEGGIAGKSKAEELVDTIRKNMLEGDVQCEVVMDDKQFEDYLINQQVILFDNQRQNKGLKEVKASGNGKSENNESEIRDAI